MVVAVELGGGGGMLGAWYGERGRVAEVSSGRGGRPRRCKSGGAEEAAGRVEALAVDMGGRLGLRLRELTRAMMRAEEYSGGGARAEAM